MWTTCSGSYYKGGERARGEGGIMRSGWQFISIQMFQVLFSHQLHEEGLAIHEDHEEGLAIHINSDVLLSRLCSHTDFLNPYISGVSLMFFFFFCPGLAASLCLAVSIV
jgi:hypothetical protein